MMHLEQIEQKADVQRLRRVGQRAHADEVDAGLGDRADALQRDAARRLELGAPAGELDRRA